MGRLILVLGGARSGKSGFAQGLAAQAGGRVLYVATAAAMDEEMRLRIARHRRTRPADWQTREEPHQVARVITEAGAGVEVVLVDCLTLLVSNLLLERGIGERSTAASADSGEAAIMSEIEALLAAARESPAEVILVANEVGQGVVPPTVLGRVFRDVAGRVNQRIAAAADEVHFLVAGLARRLK